MPENAAFYIDGFNLYHAINDMGRHYLKWTNLWKLAELLIPSQSQKVAKVVLCTATRTDDQARLLRQRAFLAAQESVGVTCLKGHFTNEPRSCRSCDHGWEAPVEKQGDVNVAISLIDDAYRNVFEHAYLVTADSDQAATVSLFMKRFPKKTITMISPPGRGHSKHILSLNPKKLSLEDTHLEKCLLPKTVTLNGKLIIRPAHYDPP